MDNTGLAAGLGLHPDYASPLKFNDPGLSLVKGSEQHPLSKLSLGQLLEQQARKYPQREAIVVPWTGERLTYYQLNENSRAMAKGLLALGVGPDDRVGISSGNCGRYVELFFAICRIGAMALVMNPAYTVDEYEHALRHAGCKILFTLAQIGRQDMRPVLSHLRNALQKQTPSLPELQYVVIIRRENPSPDSFLDYDSVVQRGLEVPTARIDELTDSVDYTKVCNLQFTSGTTGKPKAAMLTHHGLVNNGLIIGRTMRITENDRFCSPPPLFHGFGIFLCLMTSVTHGSCLVFPNDVFDAVATLRALTSENCSGFNGVPTMYVAVLQEVLNKKVKSVKIRTGITSGAPVPRHLMNDFKEILGMPDQTIIYGLTETTGAVFMTSVVDHNPEKMSTIGTICPHTSAKIIGPNGQILPRGSRGELCIAGYCVTNGYFRNPEKTKEALVKDAQGTIWLHTGDEAVLNERGYCRITGRIKDIIIRGGENIYPTEVEDRLAAHPSIAQSSVVGLNDEKYQEIVAAFIEQRPSSTRPSDEDIRNWVRQKLGRHKAPTRIFWVGKEGRGVSNGVGVDSGLEAFPSTASGKIKKIDLREFGNRWLNRENRAKL